MKKKRLLAGLIAAFMVLSLGACSKKAPAEEPVEEEPVVEETEEEPVEEQVEEDLEEAEEESVEVASDTVDTSVSVSGKASKDGFNSSTNTVFDDAGFTIEIPLYWGDDRGEDDTHQFIAETGNGVTMLQITFMDNNMSGASFEAMQGTLYDQFINALGLENAKSAPTKNGGRYFEGVLQGISIQGEIEVFFNESKGRIMLIAFVQSADSSADYFPDYTKMIQSIVVK